MHLLLLHGFLVFFVLLLLFELDSLNFLEGRHVSIENLPLRSLQREGRTLWGVGFYTLFAEGQVEGLRRSLLEVELVAEGLLLCAVVALEGVLTELLLDCHIHLVKEALIAFLLVLPVLLLVAGLV